MKIRKRQNMKDVEVYLIGSGIASLASAVYLEKDAGVPGKNILILERSTVYPLQCRSLIVCSCLGKSVTDRMLSPGAPQILRSSGNLQKRPRTAYLQSSTQSGQRKWLSTDCLRPGKRYIRCTTLHTIRNIYWVR